MSKDDWDNMDQVTNLTKNSLQRDRERQKEILKPASPKKTTPNLDSDRVVVNLSDKLLSPEKRSVFERGRLLL